MNKTDLYCIKYLNAIDNYTNIESKYKIDGRNRINRLYSNCIHCGLK